MSLALHLIAPNFTRVDVGDLTVWFSYESPIAYRDRHGLVIRENSWGPTTGKHLNAVHPDKGRRIPSAEFESKINALLIQKGLS